MIPKMETRIALFNAPEQTDSAMLIEGVAIAFESPTVLWEDGDVQYKEVIDRNALTGADMSDVILNYNHGSTAMILARSTNGTLQLQQDANGLMIRAEIAPTTAGKDIYTLIKRGDINKMSFSFTVADEEYNHATKTRRIKRIKKLYDVSVVDNPAYQDTSVDARAYYGSKEECVLQTEEKRKKLILKTYL